MGGEIFTTAVLVSGMILVGLSVGFFDAQGTGRRGIKPDTGRTELLNYQNSVR